MSEGEFKKRLYECLQFGHEFTMEEVYRIVDEARKEIPNPSIVDALNNPIKLLGQFQAWFLKWLPNPNSNV